MQDIELNTISPLCLFFKNLKVIGKVCMEMSSLLDFNINNKNSTVYVYTRYLHNMMLL